MASALIIYGSSTGNTLYVAEEIERVLAKKDIKVKVMNASSVKAEGLCSSYDLVLFGCSTWGNDSIELQDDFIPLFDAFDKIGVNGKKVAVFGCGLSDYEFFCGAVDAISEKLTDLGAQLIDSLKIDDDPQNQKDLIESWAEEVASTVP